MAGQRPKRSPPLPFASRNNTDGFRDVFSKTVGAPFLRAAAR
jgi:hypothetical protein